MNKIKKLLVLLILIFGIMSCGRVSKTYVDDSAGMMDLYVQENFGAAMDAATKFVDEVVKEYPNDAFVALLELAKIEMDAGNYKDAIKHLAKAQQRFVNIEGTISISEEATSVFFNDTTAEYEAEPLEKLLIPPYLAICYWLSGDFDAARVERKKTINVMTKYIKQKGEEAEYLENPFNRYLTAIMFENEKDNDAARIEMKNIGKFFPSIKAKMDSEIQRSETNPKKSDLVVFVDLGRTPTKSEVKQPGTYPGPKGPIVVNIVYAEFKELPTPVKKCKVYIDGKDSGVTDLLYDMSKTVLAQYEKNKPKIIAGVIKKVATKVLAQGVGQSMQQSSNTGVKAAGLVMDIFGKASAAIERADLRSWRTLPASIQSLRLNNLTPGQHKVQLGYIDINGNEIGKSAEKTVNIRDGEISIAHFRVVK